MPEEINTTGIGQPGSGLYNGTLNRARVRLLTGQFDGISIDDAQRISHRYLKGEDQSQG